MQLEPRAALALGIAVHELATNAAKYGALSVGEGSVAVTWKLDHGPEGEDLALDWIERNGPPVTVPDQHGFGMTRIERGFAYDLSSQVIVNFAATGVKARLCAPPGGQSGQQRGGRSIR